MIKFVIKSFQGFEYLNCVCDCSKTFYNETIEKTLQDWMTFLLQFLEITNIIVIKMLKGMTTHLLNRKELSAHYINEVKYQIKFLYNLCV